ncbi:hypothetical protein VMCG_02300 [Cytospora schulzeri]|uniref:Uncharacterized protein n=1 Tax=Cytospora schulzeri TaxID=448051 RepID=A0A423X190_9PEZI|nr:hypothetical protein VMCG_02300 [Valsa malicola]
MAATISEAPAQYERDFRSANHEWKRGKDARAKWSYGSTATAPWYGCLPPDVESENFKAQPLGKQSEQFGPFYKDKGNINKYARTTGRMKDIPSSCVRPKVSAQEEIDAASRSILDYLPSPVRRQSSTTDNILYSFDHTESPGRPLTLDVFVKTTGRDTEKLVEKEYEILDANGDAVKGKKARRTLRQGATTGANPASDEPEVDEDGFELV